tara:strand:- start:1125 stop:1613 length:489 start_codon:yes stop_codon:yes gene_type:complete
MKLIVFLLIAFLNTNQIIAQDKKRKKKQDIENSLDLDKITFDEAVIKLLELQNWEENVFNPLLSQTYQLSGADLILDKDELEALRQEAIKDWHKIQIRINKKYFTEEDLIEVIKFFSTDAGKKMNKNLLTMSQENYSEGYEWGLKFGNKIRELINKKREEKN